MPGEKSKKSTSKRRPGASKPGYYAHILDEAERLDYEAASGVDGIDDEIALLRVKIKKAMSGGDAAHLELLVKATNALERLVRTRYSMTREQRQGLKQAIGNVLKDIAIPLGIKVGTAVIEKNLGG